MNCRRSSPFFRRGRSTETFTTEDAESHGGTPQRSRSPSAVLWWLFSVEPCGEGFSSDAKMSQDRVSVAVLKQAYPRNACGACFEARACIVRIHAAESQHWNS